MTMKRTVVLLVIIAAVVLPSSMFTVDQTQVAIVTRFGDPLDGTSGPGLHFKLPWPIDSVVRLDQRLLLFDNEPAEMLTGDRKNVLVDSFIVWRVADPLRFAQTVRRTDQAEARLVDLIASELGAEVGSHPMEDFINAEPSEVRISDVAAKARSKVDALARSSFGIEVVDLQINGFNLPPQNRASVIDRMRAERARIATAYRSEGEEEALKIEAEAAAEQETILAEARAAAELTRGAGEAEALRIFADAYRRDPELYRFLRTLESYEAIIDEDTTIVIESSPQLDRALGGR
jgi:membrane protease subunit HflC